MRNLAEEFTVSEILSRVRTLLFSGNKAGTYKSAAHDFSDECESVALACACVDQIATEQIAAEGGGVCCDAEQHDVRKSACSRM